MTVVLAKRHTEIAKHIKERGRRNRELRKKVRREKKEGKTKAQRIVT
jgi:hypothetical protein